LAASGEVFGPERDGPRVGLKGLPPLGDAGARPIGSEHQPVALGRADGLSQRATGGILAVGVIALGLAGSSTPTELRGRAPRRASEVDLAGEPLNIP
jgi:hypothetical protein